jgi:hypothetical protein
MHAWSDDFSAWQRQRISDIFFVAFPYFFEKHKAIITQYLEVDVGGLEPSIVTR